MKYEPDFLNVSSCRGFDPRLRPWYVSPVTGPKIIVILIDDSGSMKNNQHSTENNSGKYKIDVAIEASNVLISTLTEKDRLSIILQSNKLNVFNYKKDECISVDNNFNIYDNDKDGELNFEEFVNF